MSSNLVWLQVTGLTGQEGSPVDNSSVDQPSHHYRTSTTPPSPRRHTSSLRGWTTHTVLSPAIFYYDYSALHVQTALYIFKLHSILHPFVHLVHALFKSVLFFFYFLTPPKKCYFELCEGNSQARISLLSITIMFLVHMKTNPLNIEVTAYFLPCKRT